MGGSEIEEIPTDQPEWIQILIKIQTGKLNEIPDDTIFEKDVDFYNCTYLKKIGKGVQFK